MIIKLAAFSKEEEEKIRLQLQTPSVKSSLPILNYAHPATIGGGILGAFVGSEVGDKAFGGNHLNEIYKTISVPTKKKMFGLLADKETFIQKITKPQGIGSRLSKNILRGGLGAIGAGLGAIAVNKLRERKKKNAS